MGILEETLRKIQPLDEKAMALAQQRLDSLTKPRGSLGVLENLAVQVAGIMGNPMPAISKKAVVVMAGDHGVVDEGVSAFPQAVTKQMVANFIRGGAAINVIGRKVGAQVQVVDVGIKGEVDIGGVMQKKVKNGTRNMAVEPAMTREEAIRAMEVGIEVAQEFATKGVNLFGTGEMGIGNTTPSSALLAVFGGFPVEEITGRGTGIDDGRLRLKINTIKRAIEINKPNPEDPIDVLAKVGGLEIAGLVGLIIGAAAQNVPVIIDGFISSGAALTAVRITPLTKGYMIPSHISQEPGHRRMLETIGLDPILHLQMRLGEGTGACIAMELVEIALGILHEMATFSEAEVEERL